MSLVKWGFIGLLALPAAELLAFVLVAALIGWLWAAALFVATSVVGALLLRRSGRGDLDRLRAAFARDGLRAVHLESPGAASMVGGILLYFLDLSPTFWARPCSSRGFADGLGAKSPRRRGSAVVRRQDDHVIDLEPSEWHQITDQSRNRPRKAEEGAKPGSKQRPKRGSKRGADILVRPEPLC